MSSEEKAEANLILSIAVTTVAAALGRHFGRDIIVPYAAAILLIAYLNRRLISAKLATFLERRHFIQDQLDPYDFSLKPRGVAQRLAIALHWGLTQIRQLSPTDAPVLAACFGFGLVTLLFFRPDLLDPTSEFFKDNIIPELFGFVLDGLLILGLLGYFGKKKEAREREALCAVLRTFLWRYAEHACHKLKLADDPSSILNSEYAAWRIRNNFTFAWLETKPARQANIAHEAADLAKEDVDTATALLSVAASLGPKHAELWFRVMLQLKKLATVEPDVFNKIFIDLLGMIIELDEMNFLGRKPTLNIQQLINLR